MTRTTIGKNIRKYIKGILSEAVNEPENVVRRAAKP
jgi:hypothetical protein